MSENTWNIITESLDLLRSAAAGVSDRERDRATPCREWTALQVLQHAAGDQLAWAAAIGVGTGPTENPFTPSGRLEGRIEEFIEPALAVAARAWAGVGTEDAVLPTPLPQGPLPVRTAALACALDAAVHAWDVEVALGRPAGLADELAGQLLPGAPRHRRTPARVRCVRPRPPATAWGRQPRRAAPLSRSRSRLDRRQMRIAAHARISN